MISDLSGEELGENGQTVTFTFQGVEYEIDLSPQEADELAAATQKYIDAARRVGNRRQSGRSGTKAAADPEQTRKMRQWANENGYQVSNRGRVPQAVQDAYHAGS